MQPFCSCTLITRARDYFQATALKPQLIKGEKLAQLHAFKDVNQNFVDVEQSSFAKRQCFIMWSNYIELLGSIVLE